MTNFLAHLYLKIEWPILHIKQLLSYKMLVHRVHQELNLGYRHKDSASAKLNSKGKVGESVPS